ncbi:hypothetical protein GHT06_003707 [Daphnia sinensis]|uniref:CN hydrolase domain-containing protein n=1 Tax=Daphnia sinensis TaxID=1820382 RepID=A0AAD5KT97_9CRUS|nr:hypothetical protein GHT06_003707 [Daphnia sinensis]
MLEEKIWQIEQPVDLILLPEMFPTGFSMDAPELAEHSNLGVTKWMKQMATQTKSVIAGSVIIQEGGDFFNRLLWFPQTNGARGSYIFRRSKNTYFLPHGWNICPQICYDLRFPVWSRNRQNQGKMAYDLIFYVASWPAARISAWDALLPARAIENLAYSIGVNRVGIDGNGLVYNGHSAAYDFRGTQICSVQDQDQIQIVTLDAAQLEEYRQKFPAWMDADDFEIQL